MKTVMAGVWLWVGAMNAATAVSEHKTIDMVLSLLAFLLAASCLLERDRR